MRSNRDKAVKLLDKLTNDGDGVSERMLLEFLIYDYMTGEEAYNAMLEAEKEFFNNPDDAYSSDEYDSSSFDEDEY